jgi:DNA-binding HxlR family transcriptional regulator
MSKTRKTPAPKPRRQKRLPRPRRRSACPLNASVEILGDRWSILILRDLMVGGARTYNDLLRMPEHIATNVLAQRLRRLVSDGVIVPRPDAADGRSQIYQLTRKGIDLAPVLTELVLWAGRHEPVGNWPLIRAMRTDKEGFIAQVRRQWAVSRVRARRAGASDLAGELARRDHRPDAAGAGTRRASPPAK